MGVIGEYSNYYLCFPLISCWSNVFSVERIGTAVFSCSGIHELGHKFRRNSGCGIIEAGLCKTLRYPRFVMLALVISWGGRWCSIRRMKWVPENALKVLALLLQFLTVLVQHLVNDAGSSVRISVSDQKSGGSIQVIAASLAGNIEDIVTSNSSQAWNLRLTNAAVASLLQLPPAVRIWWTVSKIREYVFILGEADDVSADSLRAAIVRTLQRAKEHWTVCQNHHVCMFFASANAAM